MMRSMPCRWFPALSALLVGFPAALIADEPATQTFAAQKCSYKLPDPDWKFVAKKTPLDLFTATNSKLTVRLVVNTPPPGAAQVNQQFVNGLEGSVYKNRTIKKRGGHFMTFKGVEGYQMDSTAPDGNTFSTRVFAAHGMVYSLVVLGGRTPVDADPKFESAMSGFEFTVPPEKAPVANAVPAVPKSGGPNVPPSGAPNVPPPAVPVIKVPPPDTGASGSGNVIAYILAAVILVGYGIGMYLVFAGQPKGSKKRKFRDYDD